MNKTTKTISYITIILLISKIFGFPREMVIAAYYGASWQTDAFNMALNIVSLSTVILSMGVATVVVPMYNHRLVQKSKEEADKFASNILCVTSIAYGILSAIGIIFAPVLTKLLAPDFDVATSALSAQLLRILFVFSIATNAVSFLSSVSRSNNRFLVPSLIGFPLTISNILFITLLSKRIGIYAMVAGYICAYLIQFLMVAISLRKTFKFKAIINFTNGDVKEIIMLSLPIFVSVGVEQLNTVIDRMLASGLVEGSITAMGYAQRLRELPNGIITVSIITVIFPMFSQYAAKNDFGNIKALASKAMSILFAVMTPISLVCVFYSKEIVQIVYERGAFTHEQTLITAYIFIYTILALFFIGGCQVLNNAFYGMQDTKTPRLGAVIAVGSNIVLNLILIRYMQAAGLALATSIACMLNYIILLIFFRRKCGSFGGFAFLKNIIKCTIATAAMLPVFLVCGFFRNQLPVLVFFCASVVLGFLLYAILLYIMKVDIFMFGLQKVTTILKIDSRGKRNKKNNINNINKKDDIYIITPDFSELKSENSFPEMNKFQIKNIIEEIVVEETAAILKKMTNMCKCEKCFNDICAIVLNSISSQYVTTHEGELFQKAAIILNAESATKISIEIFKAIDIVKHNPNH